MSETYDLVLAFDSDEPEFARGFELGGIWKELQDCHTWDERTFTIRAASTEMALRIAEALDMRIDVEIVDVHWSHVTFSPKTPW